MFVKAVEVRLGPFCRGKLRFGKAVLVGFAPVGLVRVWSVAVCFDKLRQLWPAQVWSVMVE